MATSSPPTPRPAPIPSANGSRPPGAPSPAPAAPKASRLGAVKRGLLREAKRFFFYGPEGVGKSSLAKDANAIFFDIDRGSGHLDVPRYAFRDGSDGHIAESIIEVYAGIDDLLVAPHDFKALAIDTSDSLEALLQREVCRRAGVTKSGDVIENIDDFGFGKGPKVAAAEWRVLLQRLDNLRIKRGMHVIFVGHSLVKTFKNPTGEDYDRYRPKLDDLALGLLREWCEVVGFVTFDDVAKRNKGATRARGTSSGLRVIQLEHNAAWDAKSRLPLPPMIELTLERPWSPFEQAIDALYNADPAVLRDAIDVELVRLGAEFIRGDGTESKAEAARARVAEAGNDTSTLTKYLNALKQAQPKESK